MVSIMKLIQYILLLGLVYLGISTNDESFAQCTGQFQAGQACINPLNTVGPPTGGTTFPALMRFSLGLYSDNFYTITGAPFFNGSASVSGSPNLVLSNIFGGTNQGPGLSFNSLNSALASITSHYTNCGFSVITAGSELSTCDEGYRAPGVVNKIITTAVSSSSSGCVLCTGNDDNFWSLGSPSSRWASISLAGTISGGGAVSGGGNGTWNDQTSIIGSGALAAFYSPFYYTNPGTGIVDRINRLFVGAPAASVANGGTSNDILSSTGLPTSPGWLDTLVGVPVVGASQFASGSTFGDLGVTGYCRSSDHYAVFAAETDGCQGITGFAYNNDTLGSQPIAVGAFSFSSRASGVGGVTVGNQSDVNNHGSIVDLTPYGTITGGVTIGSLVTSGSFSSLGNASATADIVISPGRTSGPTARKGIIVMSTALDTSLGDGGKGIAMEMADGQSIQWRNSSGTLVASMWGNAGGGLIQEGTIISLGGVVVDSVAPTVGAGEVGYGSTTLSPGSGTCPTGTVGGQTVQGCIVINVAGTSRNLPFF